MDEVGEGWDGAGGRPSLVEVHSLLYIAKSAECSALFYSTLLDYVAFGGTWSEDAPDWPSCDLLEGSGADWTDRAAVVVVRHDARWCSLRISLPPCSSSLSSWNPYDSRSLVEEHMSVAMHASLVVAVVVVVVVVVRRSLRSNRPSWTHSAYDGGADLGLSGIRIALAEVLVLLCSWLDCSLVLSCCCSSALPSSSLHSIPGLKFRRGD